MGHGFRIFFRGKSFEFVIVVAVISIRLLGRQSCFHQTETHMLLRGPGDLLKDHRRLPGSEYPVVKFKFFVLTASSCIWCVFFTG